MQPFPLFLLSVIVSQERTRKILYQVYSARPMTRAHSRNYLTDNLVTSKFPNIVADTARSDSARRRHVGFGARYARAGKAQYQQCDRLLSVYCPSEAPDSFLTQIYERCDGS